MSFQISLDIHRSPAEVFAFVADFQNMPAWYDAVQHVAVTTPASSGTGARFRMMRSLPGGPAYNDVEVASYQQDSEVTFASTSGPTPFRYHYQVEPIADGTRLTLNGDISGEGLPGPAAHLGALAGQLFKQGMKKNLQVLKRILENDRA
jgi:Polyketide cyclase / dehydrase and lipid transport